VLWRLAARIPLALALLAVGGLGAREGGALTEPIWTQSEAPIRWTLALGGDAMLNGVSPTAKPLAGVARFFSNADLAVVNLEIPLTRAVTRTSRKSARDLARRTQFILKADPAHIEGLAAAGIDAATLGNNHALDYGTAGLAEMGGLLKSKGILACGAGTNRQNAFAPAVMSAPGGLKVALISMLAFRTKGGLGACTPATENRPGVAALDLGGDFDQEDVPRIQELVRRAKSAGEVILVALHWGNERETVPTPYQVALGRAFVDAGADVVIGHHPHVLQGSELYKGKPILYSLGNLVSSIGGPTAVYRVHFEGREPSSVSVQPCYIGGGRVGPVKGATTAKRLEEIRALGAKQRAKYPSKDSRPLHLRMVAEQ
jgi:poly-gamma-glutamate synthesis protein (capsule biosynthesis protein)